MTETAQRMLPLYEAKMIHHFDHRLGTYEGQTRAQANMGTLPRLTAERKQDPSCTVLPRYWVAEEAVEERLKDRWNSSWLLGWRDICRSTDERTMIDAVIPRTAAPDGTLLMFPSGERPALLVGNLGAFVLDYVVRQKSGGTHLKYFTVKQLPILSPKQYEKVTPWHTTGALADWIEVRVLELTFTAWDMESFGRDLRDEGPPFIWDADRRFAIRAELDAAYFHLYGVQRDDVGYIMDSFGAFQRNDPDRFGRTRTLIGEIYDAMATAIETGKPYDTVLDPPPGQGARHPDTRPA